MLTKLELGAGYLTFTNAQGENWRLELNGVSDPEITASLYDTYVRDASGNIIASIADGRMFSFSCNARSITLEKNNEYRMQYAPTEISTEYSEEDIRELIIGEQE